MKLLSLKYKMHKLVNLFFYLIIFGVGFLLGFGADKINFNKIIGQILFIDNVSAYTLQSGANFEFNEEYIYNKLSTNENFNLIDFPYIHCYRDISFAERALSCYALSTTDIFHNKNTQNSYTHMYVSKNSHTYIRLTVTYNDNSIVSETVKYLTGTSYIMLVHTENTKYFTYTNYDLSNLSPFPGNVLDFSSFTNSGGDNGNTGDDNGNTGDDNGNTGDDNENTGDDNGNTGDDNGNTGDDNGNTGGDNKDEDIEIEVVKGGFYEFAQKIFGEVSEENKFIYDFITFGLVATCFMLFVLIVGYIFNKFFGG